MKNLFLTGLAIILFLPACKKKDPEASLPAATQVGANTGGCLINGQPFVAAKYGGGVLSNPIPALDYGFSFDSLYYLVMTGTYQGSRATITLFLRSRRVGKYLFDKTTPYYPMGSPRIVENSATFAISNSNGETYVTDAQHTGQIELTRADTVNFIASGLFEFTAVSTLDPTKMVTITNGRFDRKD